MKAEPIQTERLLLSPLRVGDAEGMVLVLAHDSLYEFIGGEAPTLDTLTERYRSQTSGSGVPDEVWLNWIVRPVGDQRPVGFVQATVYPSTADIAWLVGVQDQGRGIATESARAVSVWLAASGVQRVEAHVHPSHAASQAVASHIGLVPTSTLDSDGEEIWAADFAERRRPREEPGAI